MSNRGGSILRVFKTKAAPSVLAHRCLQRRGLGCALGCSLAATRRVVRKLLTKGISCTILKRPFLDVTLQGSDALRVLTSLGGPSSTSLKFTRATVLCIPALGGDGRAVSDLLGTSYHFTMRRPRRTVYVLRGRGVFAFNVLAPRDVRHYGVSCGAISRTRRGVLRFLRLVRRCRPGTLKKGVPSRRFCGWSRGRRGRLCSPISCGPRVNLTAVSRTNPFTKFNSIRASPV